MQYISTRGRAGFCSAGQAVMSGLASDGGLYVPENIPAFNKPLAELCRLSYAELACEILKLYLTDYPEAELREAITAAYAVPSRFDDARIAPLADCRAEGVYFLELFHGRTLAFKDMALSLLPGLLTSAVKRYEKNADAKIIILTATSGDTGKAALEAFADVPGVEVAVFYPVQGVSEIQRLQMITQEGSNTHVIGVRGNFDDTQTGVKNIFSDKELAEKLAAKGAAFSSANSINIGRLLPQIVYYVYAYGQLCERNAVKTGDEIDFAVPTGNFGNILAGYYAKKMGLPIGKLICASNKNNVLHQFFNTGEYDANREFFTTMSPSMDILISSNLERLLFHLSGDPGEVRRVMAGLKSEGRYDFKIPAGDFNAAFADENGTVNAMREIFELGYLADPHTAVGYHAAKIFKRDGVPVVIPATASPYKFAENVIQSIAKIASDNVGEPFRYMTVLNKISGVQIPGALANLKSKPIRHTSVCLRQEMRSEAEKLLI